MTRIPQCPASLKSGQNTLETFELLVLVVFDLLLILLLFQDLLIEFSLRSSLLCFFVLFSCLGNLKKVEDSTGSTRSNPQDG